MIALMQRVSRAGVEVDGDRVGSIDAGLLALVAVEPADSESVAERLLGRLLACRVFPDRDGKMNLNVGDVGGGLLLVPNFTLAADTRKGTRPNFSGAAPPEQGERLFRHLVEQARARHPRVAAGRFGAHMAVSLVNDGPVTLWLRAP